MRWLVMGVVAACTGAAWAGESTLRVMGEDQPRAFFFRAAEQPSANPRIAYEQWEADFSRLMGIIGKVVDEEVPGRSSRNIDFFTRFKRAHADQVVLMHYNGNGRDPRFESGRFFAGHWLYHNGAKIESDVPAAAGETDLRVSDPGFFLVNTGRYRTSNEDIGLCALDAAGRPDWTKAEQVTLVSVDRARRTIRVRRGCYGTAPIALPAGKGYAAAHVTEGPWGKSSHLLWAYNYATRSPKDARGRSCGEVHAEHLAELFALGGKLAAFDGLEFDVLHDTPGAIRNRRGPDCDADGVADGGMFDGTNDYGNGVVAFCRALRQKLGEGRIIQADGALGRLSEGSQRAFGIMNGIESEGWPNLRDGEVRDWSGGMNRMMFWAANARRPAFSYVNHKFVEPGPEPGVTITPEVPFRIHRLVFAAAVFSDAAICYSFAPPGSERGRLAVWDELCMGSENRAGWLGKAKGPPVRLAKRSPDLLAGAPIAQRLRSDDAQWAMEQGALKVWAKNPAAERFHLRIAGVDGHSGELTVFLTARADPDRGRAPESARLMWMSASADPKAPRFMSYVNGRGFESSFYFESAGQGETVLELEIESSEPVWIERISVHAHADAIARAFEHGMVLANPSPRPFTFDLERLFPDERFRRLRGTAKQDAKTNDGTAVGRHVELEGKDGLFLVRAE